MQNLILTYTGAQFLRFQGGLESMKYRRRQDIKLRPHPKSQNKLENVPKIGPRYGQVGVQVAPKIAPKA